jgi:hypothetical protein
MPERPGGWPCFRASSINTALREAQRASTEQQSV